jgi:hypothetical protein
MFAWCGFFDMASTAFSARRAVGRLMLTRAEAGKFQPDFSLEIS